VDPGPRRRMFTAGELRGKQGPGGNSGGAKKDPGPRKYHNGREAARNPGPRGKRRGS
jgi:hypothetical protein